MTLFNTVCDYDIIKLYQRNMTKPVTPRSSRPGSAGCGDWFSVDIAEEETPDLAKL